MTTVWWRGAALEGTDAAVATVEGATITADGHRITMVSTSPASLRGVDERGQRYLLRKTSLTVARYAAECGGRPYTVRRTRGRCRDIIDARGTTVATTNGHLNGELEVTVLGDCASEALVGDLLFITWALTYVDTPTRRLRY
ncbi:hypothetical protein [Corynebacterium sp. UMB2355A]|uniref:hypothetical protein n=1 Tax=Corynebacterium sp. UMB2355A TaxID=3081222 RepID=UPI0029FF0349|nr:hypothetical protein [Corynebacterium sp. UMB2355A]WPJ93348.1 hypothetical protein R0V12_03025 [Corynebacterium sp. UMB2355A]